MTTVLKDVRYPAAIVGFIVLLFTVEYYFVVPEPVTGLVSEMAGWSIIIAIFALPIGAINLVRIHVRHIQRRTPGRWYLSIWLLFLFGLGSMVGIYGTIQHPLFDWIYNNMQTPVSLTLSSLLGFFIISAAFKAFRARNVDAALLLVSAIIVMLGNVPVGELIWSGFPALKSWILKVPNTAGMRGIIMSVGLAAVTLILRMALGKEVRYFGIAGSEREEGKND